MDKQTRAPVIYLPHGGGPLPVLGEPGHQQLNRFLQRLPTLFEKPQAILVISAHWETDVPTVTSGEKPELIYDYSGFPEESYSIQYPAVGDPELASSIAEALQTGGIQYRMDEQRGFDHGLFIPLKLIYPQADIPCVQLSILSSLEPGVHIALGEALAELRSRNILIIGSGLSFHNLRAFFDRQMDCDEQIAAFDHWLRETCCGDGLTVHERRQRLMEWQQAPAARFCHPREEHLLPLHVCFGVAGGARAETVFNAPIMGRLATAFLWQ